jgi:hypothetical protein
VLRDLEKPQRGTLPRAPDDFLRAGDGATLANRVTLRGLLDQRPVNRDPPFVAGTGGVTLAWGSVPAARSVFRQVRARVAPYAIRSIRHTTYDIRHTTYDHVKGIS